MDTIREIGVKTLYLPDGRKASSWVREPIKGMKTFDAPQTKSGLIIGKEGCGTMAKGSLLYLHNNGNNLVDSQTLVYFVSSCSSTAHGLSVTEGEGWRRAISLFSARDLSKGTWINDKDEYLAPNTYREVG